MNELVVQIVSPDQFKELYEKCKNSDQKSTSVYVLFNMTVKYLE